MVRVIQSELTMCYRTWLRGTGIVRLLMHIKRYRFRFQWFGNADGLVPVVEESFTQAWNADPPLYPIQTYSKHRIVSLFTSSRPSTTRRAGPESGVTFLLISHLGGNRCIWVVLG